MSTAQWMEQRIAVKAVAYCLDHEPTMKPLTARNRSRRVDHASLIHAAREIRLLAES
jgi:hypothetical protein